MREYGGLKGPNILNTRAGNVNARETPRDQNSGTAAFRDGLHA